MRSHQTSTSIRRFAAVLIFALMSTASHMVLADAVGNGSGTVRDASGAVIPGAKVTLTRLSTDAAVTHVSDSSGAFQFLELAPDTYTLSVEAPGFKRATLSQIVVQVDQAARMDVLLQAGDVSEIVNVDAGAPLIDTQQNTLTNVVDPQTIASMPLNSRNFLDLALLTPGATPSANGSQVTGFNVAGARTQSNDYLIDGISNMDTQINSGLTNFRINDAVQEFSVQTSVPTAEFGRGKGAQINAVIKSGTNQIHGVLDRVFEKLQLEQIVRIKLEAVCLDSTSIKVHPDGTGALQKRIAVHRQIPRRMEHQDSYGCCGCLNGYSLDAVPGNAHDDPEGRELLWQMPRMPEGLPMLIDRAYEGDESRQLVFDLGMVPAVPPKSNRVDPWTYDLTFTQSATRSRGSSEDSRDFEGSSQNSRSSTSSSSAFSHFTLIVEALR